MGRKIAKVLAGCGCVFLSLIFVTIILMAVTRKADPKKLAALQFQADSTWRRLADLSEVVKSYNSYVATESGCGEIPTDSNQPTLRLISADDLGNFNPDKTKSKAMRWSWLDHFLFYDGTLAPQQFSSERQANDILYKLDGLAQKKLLGVIKITQMSLPTKNGEEYRSGLIDGSLLVVDLKANRVVCSAPFQASNNQEVTYKSRGLLAKDADQALVDDFQKNTKEALQAALSRILPKYKIDGVANPPRP